MWYFIWNFIWDLLDIKVKCRLRKQSFKKKERTQGLNPDMSISGQFVQHGPWLGICLWVLTHAHTGDPVHTDIYLCGVDSDYTECILHCFLVQSEMDKPYVPIGPEVSVFLDITPNSLNLTKFKIYALKSMRCCVNIVASYLTLILHNGAKTALSVNITAKSFNPCGIYSASETTFMHLKIFINICFGPSNLLVLLIQWQTDCSFSKKLRD